MTLSPQGRGRTKRETRIGLALIGVLLVVFVYVAGRRFDRPSAPPVAAVVQSPPAVDQGVSRPTTVLRSANSPSDPLAESPATPITLDNQSASRDSRDMPVEPSPLDQWPRPTAALNPSDSIPTLSPAVGLEPEDLVTGQYVPAAFDDPNDSVREAHGQYAPSALRNDTQQARFLEPPPMPLSVESDTADREESTERILSNDSFWLISQRAYGTGGYFRALFEHNKTRYPHPDQLPPGDEVDVPAIEQLHRLYPELCPRDERFEPAPKFDASPKFEPTRQAGPIVDVPGDRPQDPRRFHIVRDGETVFDVAKLKLGQMSRYVEIVELNRAQLGGKLEDLPPGLKLVLPLD